MVHVVPTVITLIVLLGASSGCSPETRPTSPIRPTEPVETLETPGPSEVAGDLVQIQPEAAPFSEPDFVPPAGEESPQVALTPVLNSGVRLLIGPDRDWLVVGRLEATAAATSAEFADFVDFADFVEFAEFAEFELLSATSEMAMASAAANVAQLPDFARSELGRRYRLIGIRGEVCEAEVAALRWLVLARPGPIPDDTWGEFLASETPLASLTDSGARTENTLLVGQLEAEPECRGALFARDVSLPSLDLYLPLPAPRAFMRPAERAFGRFQAYRDYQRTFTRRPVRGEGEWTSWGGEAPVTYTIEDGVETWVLRAARVGVQCDVFAAELMALWRSQTDPDTARVSLELMAEPVPGLSSWPQLVADFDGDGALEFLEVHPYRTALTRPSTMEVLGEVRAGFLGDCSEEIPGPGH